MHRFWPIVISIVACLAPAAEPLPRSVLVLDQSIPYNTWFTELMAAFQTSLNAGPGTPISVYSEKLESSHFKGAEYEKLVQVFINEKYRDKPIGVIVAVGQDALRFAQRLRTNLPAIPIIFTVVDEETASRLGQIANVTGTTVRLTLRDALVAARALVPNIKRIAIVGDPLADQTYRRHYQQELTVFAGDLEHIDLSGMAMADLRKRVATLPDDCAIIYTTLSIDGAGARYNPNEALAEVAEVANRPIVIDQETRLGHGATGGFVLHAAPIGRETARLALRLLSGESASNIPVAGGNFTKPVFDWRELKRWNVAESRLPPGSELRFYQPTLFDQYRWHATTALGVVLLQAGLIAGLLLERRRRHLAELETRRRLLEIAHLNRTATVGVMSASVAHELNQPLGAILLNTETLDMLLRADPVDRREIGEVVAEIRRDDQRAAKIIKDLSGFLKKKQDIETQPLDLNDVVQGALHILGPEAARKGVAVKADQAADSLPVRVDPVHLQQVILNLAINGMDAMQDMTGPRSIALRTARTGASEATVSVADDGPGIPEEKLNRIFETFYTTKQHGSGLGLSIARTIVGIYGGKIWAENKVGGGAMFRFTLPLAKTQAASMASASTP